MPDRIQVWKKPVYLVNSGEILNLLLSNLYIIFN